MNDQRKIIGRRLKECREKTKLTQAQVAEKIGIERVSVSNYEIGRVSPPWDVLIKFADLFNTSTDYLLGNTDDPDKPFVDEPDTIDLELEDEEILQKFRLKLDGEELTKEESLHLINYLRSLRLTQSQLNKQKI